MVGAGLAREQGETKAQTLRWRLAGLWVSLFAGKARSHTGGPTPKSAPTYSSLPAPFDLQPATFILLLAPCSLLLLPQHRRPLPSQIVRHLISLGCLQHLLVLILAAYQLQADGQAGFGETTGHG